MLIEKAWAKLHGTYVKTEGNLPCFAFNHLTGIPSTHTSHVSIKNKEVFFKELSEASLRHYTIIASSGGRIKDQKSTESNGINNGVSYLLLDIHQFFNEGEQVRICKLQNP